jgi:hypothetical protein
MPKKANHAEPAPQSAAHHGLLTVKLPPYDEANITASTTTPARLNVGIGPPEKKVSCAVTTSAS